jgi:nucleoside-diphosphate-sugar epimerase
MASSSPQAGRVAVTGPTGFVGIEVVRRLRRDRIAVRAIVRPGTGKTAALEAMEALGCEIAYADVRDRRELTAAMSGSTAVVHLVAIIRERGSATFEGVNQQGTANVVRVARAAGARRLVHVSALGAGPGGTRYLRSKWAGEEEVRRGNMPFVILRPSFIIGPGGGAARQIADAVRFGPWYPYRLLGVSEEWLRRLAWALPFVPILGTGRYRSTPVDLRDVVEVVAQALERDDILNQAFDLGGPEVLTYNQLVDGVARALRVRRLKFRLPLPAARAIIRLFSHMRNPPITQDEFAALLLDNVCDATVAVRTFRLQPRPFAEAIRYALAGAVT